MAFTNPLDEKSWESVHKLPCGSGKDWKNCHVYLQKRKEREEKMENKTFEKTMDIAGSVAKIAANLSETKKEEPKHIPVGDSDNSNRASTGSQNIQIHMGSEKDKDIEPIEKHIHEFPEQRSLTTEECDLALKKAQMEFELKKRSQDQINKTMDREWQHRLEQEKKDERKGKIRRIIGGILVAIGVGSVGYSIYADYRDHKNMPVAQTPVQENSNAKA
jgi:hypothetical protein